MISTMPRVPPGNIPDHHDRQQRIHYFRPYALLLRFQGVMAPDSGWQESLEIFITLFVLSGC